MSEWPYVIAAYAVTWAVVGAFAGYLRLRERAARRQLRDDAREG